jgi:hypothetical protein
MKTCCCDKAAGKNNAKIGNGQCEVSRRAVSPCHFLNGGHALLASVVDVAHANDEFL